MSWQPENDFRRDYNFTSSLAVQRSIISQKDDPMKNSMFSNIEPQKSNEIENSKKEEKQCCCSIF